MEFIFDEHFFIASLLEQQEVKVTLACRKHTIIYHNNSFSTFCFHTYFLDITKRILVANSM